MREDLLRHLEHHRRLVVARELRRAPLLGLRSQRRRLYLERWQRRWHFVRFRCLRASTARTDLLRHLEHNGRRLLLGLLRDGERRGRRRRDRRVGFESLALHLVDERTGHDMRRLVFVGGPGKNRHRVRRWFSTGQRPQGLRCDLHVVVVDCRRRHANPPDIRRWGHGHRVRIVGHSGDQPSFQLLFQVHNAARATSRVRIETAVDDSLEGGFVHAMG